LQEIPRARAANDNGPRPFKIPARFTAENDNFGRFSIAHCERETSENENSTPGNFQPITATPSPAASPRNMRQGAVL
jgi:hypothetical protein